MKANTHYMFFSKKKPSGRLAKSKVKHIRIDRSPEEWQKVLKTARKRESSALELGQQ
jgi:hypothetical protein